MKTIKVERVLPILEWGRRYDRAIFLSDLVAALIVTIMLIPQSLAYAMLAGLPPEAGLYASIVPIILYAMFGTSRSLAVGPVAVISLMTAAAIGDVVQAGTAQYAEAALVMAALSGSMLLVMGVLKLGFLANFLSHPVIAGFITASGIIIAASQIQHLTGIQASGHNLVEVLHSLLQNISAIHLPTVVIGTLAVGFLFWVRSGLKPLLLRLGMADYSAGVVARTGPVLAVAGTTLAVWAFELDARGVSIVGTVPQTLPPFTVPGFSMELVSDLALPALLISVIGFVESISVAQTLAAKKRQRINPDQELIGLGAANIGASLTGGFPVTGGFSRSVVNFDAGAETPAAGIMTALCLAVASIALTPLVYYLPKAALAATIVVAVLSLVDLGVLRRSYAYSRSDFIAVLVTVLMTLGIGVEAGVGSGVVISLLLFLYKTSRPHVAEVGLVPETQHFRNIRRHQVLTHPQLVSMRVDESLYFANARFLEDLIYTRIADDRAVRHVVLMCSAVNEIDMSALESLEAINHRLAELGIKLHLSEVKGPVLDRLNRTDLLQHLSGKVYLSQYQAVQELTGSVISPEFCQ
ncbi:MAG: sulfate permease [Granulosicoccus sp.]|nr:sulfate permease [Granulosicoccus sp.]